MNDRRHLRVDDTGPRLAFAGLFACIGLGLDRAHRSPGLEAKDV